MSRALVIFGIALIALGVLWPVFSTLGSADCLATS
jgi:hypothetical protein